MLFLLVSLSSCWNGFSEFMLFGGSQKSWQEKAIEKHGNKFDYSKFRYINSDASGIIICPEHGEFQQTPYTHLHSIHGCGKCSGNIKNPKKNL